MKTQANIQYSPVNEREPFAIPIQYSVERDGNNTTYTVDIMLNDEHRPQWLKGTSFKATEHYTPGDAHTVGVTVTDSNHQSFSSKDEALFFSAAIAQISQAGKE